MTGENTATSMELAIQHGIAPDECSRCGVTDNWRGPTVDGTDQLHDTGTLIWQHNDCGSYTPLTRHEIRAKVDEIHGAHGHLPEGMMQLCEIDGDPDNFDGWLGIPVKVIDKGKTPYQHRRLFMDLQMAVELFEVLHSLIHVQVDLDLRKVKGELRDHRQYTEKMGD